MAEICFRYSSPAVASGVVQDLARLGPLEPPPHLGGEGAREVVHVPAIIWDRPFAPEVAIGLGGRLVACSPADDLGCGADEEELPGERRGSPGSASGSADRGVEDRR